MQSTVHISLYVPKIGWFEWNPPIDKIYVPSRLVMSHKKVELVGTNEQTSMLVFDINSQIIVERWLYGAEELFANYPVHGTV